MDLLKHKTMSVIFHEVTLKVLVFPGECARTPGSAGTWNPGVLLRLCSKHLTLCSLESTTWHPHISAEGGFAGPTQDLSWGHQSEGHDRWLLLGLGQYRSSLSPGPWPLMAPLLPALVSKAVLGPLWTADTQGFSKVISKVKFFLKEKFFKML